MSDTPKPTDPTPPGSINPFDEKASAQSDEAPQSTLSGEQVVLPDADNDAEDPIGTIGPDQLKAIIAALQADLDKKTAEAAEKQDLYVRAVAETENVRRRLEREKDETAKYAIGKFAKDILTIGDNFQRAITAVPADAVATDSALKTLLDGVVLAEREYRNALERHGVTSIDPTGQPFNPHHHQAVMEHEDPDLPPGTVVKVFMSGYMLDDRCLRPAMVVVARGGASKSAKPNDAAPAGPAPGNSPDVDPEIGRSAAAGPDDPGADQA